MVIQYEVVHKESKKLKIVLAALSCPRILFLFITYITLHYNLSKYYNFEYKV